MPNDLIVSSVTGTSSSYNVGDKISATATIKNIGNGSAGSSNLKYYLGTSTNKTYKYIEQGSIGSLSPNQSKNDSINWPYWTIPSDVQSGTYYIWVQADSSYQVAESNETNNWGKSSSFTISNPILTIDTASLDFGSSDTGHTFTIRNTGGGTLTWTITDDKPWIDVSPASGSTITETDTITVTVDRSHPDVKEVNSYIGVITVDPNPGADQTVEVRMDVAKRMEIAGVPVYQNNEGIYDIPQHNALGGICVATAIADILGYWDRTPYIGITYWNLVDHGVAPLIDFF